MMAAPARTLPHAVTRLVLTDFRSYASLRLSVPAAPVVLTGRNGAGKTNLLEALSFLAPGRGLRRARMAEIRRRGASPVPAGGTAWAVHATLSDDGDAREIGTGLMLEPEGDGMSERRVVRIDGASAKSQTALAEVTQITWLTPEMDRLFMDSAGARRRFLDRLVYGFVPDHAARLSAYERSMRERNRLLKDGRMDDAWLSALEGAMAENGVAVAAARAEVVAKLAQAAGMAIRGFPRPGVAIEGEAETMVAEGPALAAEDALRETLGRNRRIDAEAGRALGGPHRSDLKVTYIEKQMPAELCSTGEQKALLVALVLATARLQKIDRGFAPILLLDEIAAHLDEGRRADLFDEICDLGAQAWMTGTDAALFEALRGRAAFATVADGGAALTPDEIGS